MPVQFQLRMLQLDVGNGHHVTKSTGSVALHAPIEQRATSTDGESRAMRACARGLQIQGVSHCLARCGKTGLHTVQAINYTATLCSW